MFSDEALGPDLCQQFVGVQLEAFCEDPTLRRRIEEHLGIGHAALAHLKPLQAQNNG
ncbi:unnamed protein product [Symbiodinium sp. KB8]|nr:unnamed protein product [Symbiodinium sp. KB8]